MGIWCLSLTASSKDDAESVKSYAGKLNAEYGFHPYEYNEPLMVLCERMLEFESRGHIMYEP